MVFTNEYGQQTIDFSKPEAVLQLNKSLLKVDYGIEFWDIPDGYLCPPIPGRADYMHYAADLLATDFRGRIPKGPQVRALDIGTGANMIYPILGKQIYGWRFLATEVDQPALKNAKAIMEANPEQLQDIELREQPSPAAILTNVLEKEEHIDISFCNPPFYTSSAEAEAHTRRKLNNLSKGKSAPLIRNFGGQASELWYEGGEVGFITKMIRESVSIAKQCLWFTSLVAHKDHLQILKQRMQEVEIADHKIIEMGQGNKQSRLVAWTFLEKEQRRVWANHRWII